MRNVIKNILSNWRNVLGKNSGLIYSFVIDNTGLNGKVFTTDDVPVELKIVITTNGMTTVYPNTFTTANATIYYNYGLVPDGSLVQFYVVEGSKFALEVVGNLVYDNR